MSPSSDKMGSWDYCQHWIMSVQAVLTMKNVKHWLPATGHKEPSKLAQCFRWPVLYLSKILGQEKLPIQVWHRILFQPS